MKSIAGRKRPHDAMGAAIFRGVAAMCCDVLRSTAVAAVGCDASSQIIVCSRESCSGQDGGRDVRFGCGVGEMTMNYLVLEWRVMRGQIKEREGKWSANVGYVRGSQSVQMTKTTLFSSSRRR